MNQSCLILQIRLLLAFTLLFGWAGGMFAQNPGDLDTTFGNGGKVITPIFPNGTAGDFHASIQPDGKIITCFSINNLPTEGQLIIARYLVDGSLDIGWGQSGIAKLTIGLSSFITPRDILLQPDGKLLVTGGRDSIISPTESYVNPFLLRLTNVGILDTTFANDGILLPFEQRHFFMWQLVILGNRVITAHPEIDTIVLSAFKLNDGSIDSTWGNNGVRFHVVNSSAIPECLVVQPDQKMLLTTRNHRTYRFMPDGQLDTMFGSNSQGYIQPFEAHSTYNIGGFGGIVAIPILKLQSNGRFLQGGGASTTANPYASKGAIECYHPDGILDTTFGNNGFCVVNFGSGLSILRSITTEMNGKILAAGHLIDTTTNFYDFALARYDSMGQIDTSFGNNGVVVTNFHSTDSIELCMEVMVQPSEKIVLAGFSRLFSQSINGFPLNVFNLARFWGDSILISGQTKIPAPTAHFDFYPNPTKTAITATLNIERAGRTELSIYDLQGRKVQELLNKELPAGDYQETFSISAQLAAGVYVLKLQTKNAQYARMLVVE